jgi:hypothetical protein
MSIPRVLCSSSGVQRQRGVLYTAAPQAQKDARNLARRKKREKGRTQTGEAPETRSRSTTQASCPREVAEKPPPRGNPNEAVRQLPSDCGSI